MDQELVAREVENLAKIVPIMRASPDIRYGTQNSNKGKLAVDVMMSTFSVSCEPSLGSPRQTNCLRAAFAYDDLMGANVEFSPEDPLFSRKYSITPSTLTFHCLSNRALNFDR